jgi:hypothetical protein
VRIAETLGTIAFATVRQSFFNCRTRFSCDSRINTGSKVYRLSRKKPLVLLRLRQCDSSEMTVANQLSHVCLRQCDSPVLYRDCCADRRSAAPGTGKRKSNRPGTGRQLSIHSGATRAALRTGVPHWYVSAGRL